MKNILFTLLSLVLIESSLASEVTIYSVYDSARLDAVFKPFTERTGVKVNIVSGTSLELLSKLKEEGASTVADLHIDKDLVYHTAAQQAGLYQAINSPFIEKSISSPFIDLSKSWFSVVYRARIIVYNQNKVSPDELSTFEDLGSSKWNKRLCLRTSNNSYNEALGAFFIEHYGPQKTLEIFKSWVNNLAIDPIKGDTDAIKAVAEGVCDIAVANSYYLAPFIRENPEYPVRPFFPDQSTVGAHVNGVGVGLIKHSKNLKNATMVMEYLASKEVQAPLANAFSQYPSNPSAELSSVLMKFGKFKSDQTNIGVFGKHVEEAKHLMKEAKYK